MKHENLLQLFLFLSNALSKSEYGVLLPLSVNIKTNMLHKFKYCYINFFNVIFDKPLFFYYLLSSTGCIIIIIIMLLVSVEDVDLRLKLVILLVQSITLLKEAVAVIQVSVVLLRHRILR